ncbi:MAG: 16S rRNA (adenine(1518)-N(6)/adenine(1519)-N(6))-dimethyltransferase RsmA [Candidatus Eiseniibacteriota bacterium]
MRERLLVRGIKPRKKWGQSFLTRPEIARNIVEAVPLTGDELVVEIGPGAGALTGLLAQRAARVVAIEFDEGLAELLTEDLAEVSRIEIVRSDIRDIRLADICARTGYERATVVGNIPYSITTPILEWLIEERSRIAGAVVLVQKEYADRLAAAPDTEDYSSLTIFARYYMRLEPLFHVPPGAFWPRPAVDSTLIRLRFRSEPPVEVPDETRLFEIVRAAFGQRRKTLANALLPLYEHDRGRVERLLRSAHVAGNRRGETLDLEEYARIARHEAPYRPGVDQASPAEDSA